MIAKITTGAGFRGSLDYLMSRKADKGQAAQLEAEVETAESIIEFLF